MTMANGFINRKLGLKDLAPLIASFGIICSILPLIPVHFWICSLPDHFRLHYMLLSVLGLLFSLRFKQLKCSVGLMFVFCLNLFVVSPWDWVKPRLTSEQESLPNTLQSLIWMNVHTSNEAKQKVVEYLIQKDFDFILLSEVNYQWIQSLEVLNSIWPYQILHPREDNFGMAVYSKFEFDSYIKLKLEAFEVPAIEMNLRAKDGIFYSILAVHPVPPMGKSYTQSRDNYLLNLSRHIIGKKQPCIVIGDFNATPWHSPVRHLLNENGLSYAAPTFHPLPATWPSAVLGIPIDLCLVDRSIRVLSHRVGPNLGSDHRPLELHFMMK